MTKLLRGDFARLFKSRLFWFGTVFMFILSVFSVWSKWRDSLIFPDHYYNYTDIPDNLYLFSFYSLLIIFFTVIVGILIFRKKDLK